MKKVEIKNKVVARGGGTLGSPSKGAAASVDLSAYLPRETWEKVFKFVTDEAGNEHIFSNLPFATKYGLTMYADDGKLSLPDIFRGLPIDNNTIYWDGEVLKARGGEGGGGIAPTMLGDLTNVGSWANGMASEDRLMVQRKGSYLWTSVLLKDLVTDNEDLGKKFVTLDTNQDITGYKNFVNGVSIGGLELKKSQNDVLYLDGNLVVRGGVTMYGTDGSSVPSIMESIDKASYVTKGIASFDSSHFVVADGHVSLLNGAVGLDETKLGQYLAANGYINSENIGQQSVKYASESGMSGGFTCTLSNIDLNNLSTPMFWFYGQGDAFMQNNPIGFSYGAGIQFRAGGFLGLEGQFAWDIWNEPGTPTRSLWFRASNGYGFGNDWKQIAFLTDNVESANFLAKSYMEDVNYAPYSTALKLIYNIGTAGLGTPNLYCSGLSVMAGYTGWQLMSYGGGDENPYFRSVQDIGVWKPWRQIAFLTDNVESATRLQNKRYIWGQEFDGTGDVSGILTTRANMSDYASLYILDESAASVGSFQAIRFIKNGTDGCSIHAFFDRFGGYWHTKKNINLHADIVTIGDWIAPTMTVTIDGKVGVGTTNPYNTLDVNGTTALRGDTTVIGNLIATGGITMYSQRSLKEIVDRRGLSLHELAAIIPTRYTWKDKRDERVHIGGIADEVMEVLPEVIYKTNDGTLTMDYGNAAFAISASLINPVCEHERRISELERENRELKREIERMKIA